MSTTEPSPEIVAAFERRATRGSVVGAAAVVTRARAASAEARVDVEPLIEGPRAHHRRSVLLAVAAVLALLVGTAVVLTRRDHPVDTVVTPQPPATTVGTWHELGRMQGIASPSWPMTPLVIGSELVLPGTDSVGSGAGPLGRTRVVDLTTGNVREIDPPSSSLLPSRDGDPAVWTGREVVVFGIESGTPSLDSQGAAGARALDPSTSVWRELQTPPFVVASAHWIGSGILAFSNVGAGATWDPDTGSWTTFRDTGPGFAFRQYTTVWTGSEVVAAEWPTSEPSRTAAFDIASTTWRTLPSLPFNPNSMNWADGRALAVDGSGRIMALDDVARVWTEVADAWAGRGPVNGSTVAVGGRLVEVGGWMTNSPSIGETPTDEVLSWGAADGRWTSLPSLPSEFPGYGVAVADGDRVLAIVGTQDRSAYAILELVLATAPAEQPATEVTPVANAHIGANIEIPTVEEDPDTRVIVDHIPAGLKPRTLDQLSGSTSFTDGSDDPRTVEVTLVRAPVDPALLDAWRSQDGMRIAAMNAEDHPFGRNVGVGEPGGRPVFVEVGIPTPTITVTLVTGLDSTVRISMNNLTYDEVEAVVRGLRVKVGG